MRWLISPKGETVLIDDEKKGHFDYANCTDPIKAGWVRVCGHSQDVYFQVGNLSSIPESITDFLIKNPCLRVVISDTDSPNQIALLYEEAIEGLQEAVNRYLIISQAIRRNIAASQRSTNGE